MSRPRHIREILPGVFAEIERRTYQASVLAAILDFEISHCRQKKMSRTKSEAHKSLVRKEVMEKFQKKRPKKKG